MKFGAQFGITHQPVFIVGFQPIDLTVAEGKISNRAVNRLIIFQRIHLEILGKALLQLRAKLLIGLIANAQHVHAVILQLAAEHPIVGRKIGGNKYNIFHSFTLLTK